MLHRGATYCTLNSAICCTEEQHIALFKVFWIQYSILHYYCTIQDKNYTTTVNVSTTCIRIRRQKTYCEISRMITKTQTYAKKMRLSMNKANYILILPKKKGQGFSFVFDLHCAFNAICKLCCTEEQHIALFKFLYWIVIHSFIEWISITRIKMSFSIPEVTFGNIPGHVFV